MKATELWLEFIVEGLCGLCANTGKITHTVSSSAGNSISLYNRHCICPNGRAIKKHEVLASNNN